MLYLLLYFNMAARTRLNVTLYVHCLYFVSVFIALYVFIFNSSNPSYPTLLNLLKPTGHVEHQQFNIQQWYALLTLYLCVLYLSQNKQRLVPLTA